MDEGAEVGYGCSIWHFSHICSGATIGTNVSIGQGCYVGGRAVVGHSCKIQNNVSIYDDVILGDGVFCGPSVVFTNVVNPRAGVDRKSEYKSTIVRGGASLGANCTIVCGSEIGEYAFVAAGAVVTADVKPFSLVAGLPARQIGWMSAYGERVQLPLKGKGRYLCPVDGSEYKLCEGSLERFKP